MSTREELVKAVEDAEIAEWSVWAAALGNNNTLAARDAICKPARDICAAAISALRAYDKENT